MDVVGTASAHPEGIKQTGTPGGFARGCVFFAGIILPCIALLFEGFTHSCGEMFFDPIPTPWHALLVAIVPLANLLAWIATRGGVSRAHRAIDALLGVAIGVSASYTLLFLPMLPMAILGLAAILYFGIGLFALLPLSPILSFAATLRFRARHRAAPGAAGSRSGVWYGILLGGVLLAALAAPGIVTRVGLRMAVSSDATEQRTGIRLLRRFADRDMLLRACYGGLDRSDSFADLIWLSDRDLVAEQARNVYFRVTGESFDATPPPTLRTRRGARWRGTDEFDFDEEQGGERVAGRLRGLWLTDSRLDGSISPDAATAYLEWTLVFRNDDPFSQREARAQLLLPPGAVVSRLTLWIDGEEREAAFGGRSQVRSAYREVVRVQRRDPVLVSTCGPDRILLQCFPVEPRGGTMKTRVGITMPLALRSPETASFELPRLLERNFGIAAATRHAVWLESMRELTPSSLRLAPARATNRGFALQGDLETAELNDPAAVLHAARDPAVSVVWARDKTNDDGHYVRQTLLPQPVDRPDRIVFVVDGSKSMERFLDEVAKSFDALGPDSEFGVLFAGDEPRAIAEPTPATPAAIAAAREALRAQDCVGGRDNAEALTRAWDWAAQAKRGEVVWIHGPAPYLLSQAEALRQRLERSPDGPSVHAMQTTTGPCRLIELLDGIPQLRRVPRQGTVGDDLSARLHAWQAAAPSLDVRRERVALVEQPTDGVETSDHLVRLWAYGRIRELVAARQPLRTQEATELGCAYHLVTPVTGAVVLESQRQYDQAGLRPVDPASVPTVPEPETWAMILIALGVFAVMARRRRCVAA